MSLKYSNTFLSFSLISKNVALIKDKLQKLLIGLNSLFSSINKEYLVLSLLSRDEFIFNEVFISSLILLR